MPGLRLAVHTLATGAVPLAAQLTDELKDQPVSVVILSFVLFKLFRLEAKLEEHVRKEKTSES